MGELEVPEEAYYGASTQRALENFPISGQTMPREIITALAQIKKAAARVNSRLGLLDDSLADAIIEAAREVIAGDLGRQFPVDVYQTGSGTSTNMNVNEVIASRANEILGHDRHGRDPVHPNDHVNMGQSSNDVIPSALHISARLKAQKSLIPAMMALKDLLLEKAVQFADVVKVGRTHMQDAVPVTMGQEFSAWATQVAYALEGLRWTMVQLEELPLGGTAVGTGLNAHPDFAAGAIEEISSVTGHKFRGSENRFASMGGKGGLLGLSKAMSGYATALNKICSDMRFLSSGPLCGIGELVLPAVQPGSSIMPGKVNPVILESTIQVCARVMGNDVTMSFANSSGNLELNVMMPLMGTVTLESITLLANSTRTLADKCIRGMEPDRERCQELVEKSLALVTPLAAKIGYDEAAGIAKEAFERRRTIREVVREKGILSDEEIEEVLDPVKMV
jgi:fumarate hydratase class II